MLAIADLIICLLYNCDTCYVKNMTLIVKEGECIGLWTGETYNAHQRHSCKQNIEYKHKIKLWNSNKTIKTKQRKFSDN